MGCYFLDGKEYQDDTVFISNIPQTVTEDQIGDMFGAIGIIKVTVINWGPATAQVIFSYFPLREKITFLNLHLPSFCELYFC